MIAFARPSTVGAILPSSRHLAHAMAEAADGADHLIELGAGTGAITEALRQRHPDVPTAVVEMEPKLAQHLRLRFPGVKVLAVPAHEALEGATPSVSGSTVLVSSLPFRSLPEHWRLRSSLAIEAFLLAHPQRRLVQYTYQPRAPFDLDQARRLRWRRLSVVWRNAPPAWIWELATADHQP